MISRTAAATPSARTPLCVALAALLVFPIAASAAAPVVLPDSDKLVFFDSKVYPLLKERCFKCHGGEEKIKGGLRLTSREGLLKGGDQGPAIHLSQPGKSLLLQMISYRDEDHQMPPKGKLPATDIDVLTRWVAAGAPYDPKLEIAAANAAPDPKSKIEAGKNYWAFRPVGNPVPPKVSNSRWQSNPIDAFLAQKLAEKKLSPARPATKPALLRRAAYDLTGLPPPPEELRAFEADKSPRAFENVIDRLLASPQYGEKWGRHWLDVARYAESNGYETDKPKPSAWRYRDYVINSFNHDKPYDQFIREQLAGDEFEQPNLETFTATAFQRLGISDDDPADKELAFYDGLDDVVATTSQVFLGLTINCARCHDHKIDPIPQRDYYRMLAFFHNLTRAVNTTVAAAGEVDQEDRARREAELRGDIDALESRSKTYEDQIVASFSNVENDDAAKDARVRESLIRQKQKSVLPPEDLEKFLAVKKELQELRKTKLPALPETLCVKENGPAAPDTFILLRGNPGVKGEKVQPGFPGVLGAAEPIIAAPPPGAKTTRRRTALAEWIASKDNPLTARVMVNRIWQHHFGRGIVRSGNNFGLLGDKPTHPDLLDWLAREFMNRGWSIKALHKQIMLSQAYQMSSQANDAGLRKDPNNDLFWRFDMRRLTAEEVRDSVIFLSGRLNLKLGGASVYTDVPAAVLATASRPDAAWGKSAPADQNRRSVYVFVKRSLIEPVLGAFDLADTDSSCAVRFATTVPTQSLTMLNGKFFNDQAGAFAERLRREAGTSREPQVRLALSLALSRPPTPKEIKTGVATLADLEASAAMSAEKALSSFCLLVINLNEFVYLD